MKRKLLALCCGILLLVCACPILPVAAAEGSVTVSPSKKTATIGDKVTVTITYNGGKDEIASIEAEVLYNTNTFTLDKTSGPDGATINGKSGKTTLLYEMPGDGVLSKTVAYKLTFIAKAVGDLNLSLKTSEFTANVESGLVYPSLGNPSATLSVTASNPVKSDNANLKSLTVTKGTLTPKFDPNVTSYRVSVGHDVTSIVLHATEDHEDATHKKDGGTTLKVGQNTFTITVIAPNGNKKKYTVVVTRAAAPTGNSSTGSTTPPPPEDALDVMVDGKPMIILDTQFSAIPDGFAWGSLTINRVEVPAAIHQQTGMILLYLIAEDKADSGLYIYNDQDQTFARYRALSVQGGTYLVHTLPADSTPPTGTVVGTLLYNDILMPAYTYEDTALSDFCIVWASPVDGEANWYTYDQKEGTLQRYHAVSGGGAIEVRPSTTNKPQATKAEDKPTIGKFFTSNAKAILIGGIVLAAVVVVVISVILLTALGGRKKGRH